MVDRRFCAIALVLVAGLSVLEIRGFGIFDTATQSLAADANATKAIGADIAKQEIELAKEALMVIAQYEKQGRADLGSHDVRIWSRRLVEATRKSGATKAEVMREIKDHLVRMDERVELVKALRQNARATQTDVLNAQYEALEARAWLAEEQGE